MTQEHRAAETVPGDPAELLAGLDDLPLEEHVERFAAVHDALRARLDGEADVPATSDPSPGAQE